MLNFGYCWSKKIDQFLKPPISTLCNYILKPLLFLFSACYALLRGAANTGFFGYARRHAYFM